MSAKTRRRKKCKTHAPPKMKLIQTNLSSEPPRTLWHYTDMYSFEGILNEGLIRAADLYVPKDEKPIVWFSTEQYWEPTVLKGFHTSDGRFLQLKMGDMIKRNIALYRIGVSERVAPHDWNELRELSGMSPGIARGLAGSARDLGANPMRWRGTFEAVREEQWQAIETFSGHEWVPIAPTLATTNTREAQEEGTTETSDFRDTRGYLTTAA